MMKTDKYTVFPYFSPEKKAKILVTYPILRKKSPKTPSSIPQSLKTFWYTTNNYNQNQFFFKLALLFLVVLK